MINILITCIFLCVGGLAVIVFWDLIKERCLERRKFNELFKDRK